MKLSLRQKSIQLVSANQGVVVFSVLAITAFGVIAANAMFNQSGVHPQPLWDAKKSGTELFSRSQSHPTGHKVPIKKVKTTPLPANKIPVPVMRPNSRASSGPSNDIPSRVIPVDTANVQRLLLNLGFYKQPIDGLNGPQTELAIRSFEESKYLPASGKITSSLLLLLESAVERAAADILNVGSEDEVGRDKLNVDVANENNVTARVQSGNSPTDGIGPAMITRIQVGLINYGNREVKIDGMMGNQTRIAIEQFQERFNIEVNGIPSEMLIDKLESIGALTRG